MNSETLLDRLLNLVALYGWANVASVLLLLVLVADSRANHKLLRDNTRAMMELLTRLVLQGRESSRGPGTTPAVKE